MPVVRELINRISIKLDKGSKKNADNAFDDISKRGAKSANTIKKAFAAIGIGLSIKKVTDSITDLEQNTASAKFFSRSSDEAERLLDLLDKTAQKSELISQREGKRAARTLSSFNVQLDTIKQLVPFIERIQEARPGMDFDVITQMLGDVIKSGDLQALQDLIPGIKGDLELLSKSTFGKPFGDVTEQQRAVLVLETMVKNRERLNQLAREQADTTTIEINKLKESSDDFISKFGTTTAPAIKDLLSEINKTIELLNSSKGFWDSVTGAVKETSLAIKDVRSFFTGEDNPNLAKRNEEYRQKARESGKTVLTDLPGKASSVVTSQFSEGGTFEHGLLTPLFKPIAKLFQNSGGGKNEVSGEVRVIIEGKGLNGVQTKEIERIANQVVNDKVITPIRNIRAKNGDSVPNGL